MRGLVGRYMRPHRWRVAWLAVFLLAGTGLQLLIPQAVRQVIDLD